MLDNINISIDFGEQDFNMIKNLSWTKYNTTNKYRFVGKGISVYEPFYFQRKINNLGLRFYPASCKLYIYGSWTKFLFKENITILKPKEFLDEFSSLSNYLGVDILHSNLKYLEYGFTMFMNHDAKDYNMHLIKHKLSSYLKDSNKNDRSVYFGTNRRTYVFYDKTAEILSYKGRDKDLLDVKDRVDRNNYKLLRYEAKFYDPVLSDFKDVYKQSKIELTQINNDVFNYNPKRKMFLDLNSNSKIKLLDLLLPEFWNVMVDKLEFEYFERIFKTRVLDLQTPVVTPKELKEFYEAIGRSYLHNNGVDVKLDPASIKKSSRTTTLRRLNVAMYDNSLNKYLRPHPRIVELDESIRKHINRIRKDINDYKSFLEGDLD